MLKVMTERFLPYHQRLFAQQQKQIADIFAPFLDPFERKPLPRDDNTLLLFYIAWLFPVDLLFDFLLKQYLYLRPLQGPPVA